MTLRIGRFLGLLGVRPRASAGFGGTTDHQNPALWLTDWALGRRTASGESVTHETALGLSAYYACLRNGAEDVAKLPRQVRQHRQDGRGNDLRPEHPLSRLLRRPNPAMPWGVFAQVMQHRRMGWGNAYAEIVRDLQGTPVELWPVHPARIRPELKRDGRTLVYWVRGTGRAEETVDPRHVFHLRGMGTGIEGYSVVRFASETLGLGLAAQRHAGAFFGEGLAKRLVAFVKQTMNPDAREALRRRIEGDRERNPVGSRRMPIVDVEVDVKDLGIPPDEAQFLEQREFGVEEIARWFRMNLAKIQYHKRAQGWASLDALNTDYATDFLDPQVQTWEEEIEAKLLREDERDQGYYVKFVRQALLRGDVSTRIAYYGAGYRDGWLSQNDIRELEDLNPIEDPGADEYRVQGQMTPIGERAKALPSGGGPAPSEDDSPESGKKRKPGPDEEAALAVVAPRTASPGQVAGLAALYEEVVAGHRAFLDAVAAAQALGPVSTSEALDLFEPAHAVARLAAKAPADPPVPPRFDVRIEVPPDAIRVESPAPAPVHVEVPAPRPATRSVTFRRNAEGRLEGATVVETPRE